jgi:hypothetical protein
MTIFIHGGISYKYADLSRVGKKNRGMIDWFRIGPS